MFRRAHRLLRFDRLERRLFGWLLLLTLVPMLLLLGAGYLVGTRSLQWVGTLGPWDRVAESGRALIEAAQPAAGQDPQLAAALEAHRHELSSSVLLARRWEFLGARVAAVLPWAVLVLAVLLGAAALSVGRRIAVQLARPIKELAGWADLLARGAPLPPPTERETGEVREVRALRSAVRLASVRIEAARARAVETERVRAWGEMARRVAHEMKNPLSPLRLAAHRLSRHPDADGDLHEPLEVIREETARLEELARQFAVLGRPSTGPPSDVDIADLLDRLLESDVPPHIRTDLSVSGDVPLLRAHYDALQRAFRNLIRNAVEAIDADARGSAAAELQHATAGSGSSGTRAFHDRAVLVDVRLEGDEVRVVVADTGHGIPAGDAERLFEPDFTLKAGGAGLGLAVVRQAVAAHGGRVAARPRHGGGAEFVVDLPVRPVDDLARPISSP